MKLCAYEKCQKIIKIGEPYQQESSDKPYHNIYFHRKCYNKLMKEVTNHEGLELYLARNPDLWYNISNKRGKTNKKRRKSRRKKKK